MEKTWYDRNYKLLLIIPAIILIASIIYLANFQKQNGDIIYKDVTLTGGTTITIFDKNINIDELNSALKEKFPNLQLRKISDFRTGEQKGIIIETQSKVEQIQPEIEFFLKYNLTQENSSIEFSGEALSQGFYKQLRLAILLSFFFMAIVVFLVFRTPVPSLAVILSAFADIVMTIAVVDLLGITLSTAGVIAFLILIGYSVDTDILLTTRVIKKRDGTINEIIIAAFKTGITMTLTAIGAIGVALIVIYNSSEVLRQIFTIILIGLGFDIFNTWVTNASILKWYAEKKEFLK